MTGLSYTEGMVDDKLELWAEAADPAELSAVVIDLERAAAEQCRSGRPTTTAFAAWRDAAYLRHKIQQRTLVSAAN